MNIAERLKQIMREKNLSQADVVRLCEPYCKLYNEKIGRSYLSQYLSGKHDPQRSKITILALALDVSEAWLIGLDVSKSRTQYPAADREVVALFNMLNDEQKKLIISAMRGFVNG